MKPIDEKKTPAAPQSGEALPEGALDAVSGGAGEDPKKTVVVVERGSGNDNPESTESRMRKGAGYFRPLD